MGDPHARFERAAGCTRFPGGAPPPPNANFSPPGVAAGQFRGAMPPGQQQQAPPMRVSHDYKRTATDRHPVDISRVDGLISARMNAKITRDFDKADALRMELRQLGVEVHDRDKMWFVDRPELAITTLGHAAGGAPHHNRPPAMPHHNAQPPPHYSTQPSPHAPQGAAYHPPPQAGPSSHDYNRDPNDRIYLPNEPQVHALWPSA